MAITSRKTAIFSSEEFFEWKENYNNSFEVLRLSIEEPLLEDWIDSEKQRMLIANNTPLKNISNPVILSYFRNIEHSKFEEIIKNSDGILDTYFEHLLNREKERQEINLDRNDQLKILRSICSIFMEYNIKAEEKGFIKSVILEYNKDNLRYHAELFTPPITVEELAEKLSNHALLNRIGNTGNNIGFVSDFVFGLLMGDCIITDKNWDKVEENQAELLIDANQFRSADKKTKIWEKLQNNKVRFNAITRVKIDSLLKGESINLFLGESIVSVTFREMLFKNDKFESCVFSDCTFDQCTIEINSFHNCTFISCKFNRCIIIGESEMENTCINIGTEEFLGDVIKRICSRKIEINDNIPEQIDFFQILLSAYFKKDGRTPKMRTISSLREEFRNNGNIEIEDFSKKIYSLEKDGHIIINGNNSYISHSGILNYNSKYRKNA